MAWQVHRHKENLATAITSKRLLIGRVGAENKRAHIGKSLVLAKVQELWSN